MTEDAIKRIQTVLNDKELWEDLRVVSLELNDVISDMNDELTQIEETFRIRRIRPGWTPMTYQKDPKWFRAQPQPISGALIWNGKNLLWEPDDHAEPAKPLLQASKAVRMWACLHVEPLWQELTRHRDLISSPAERTP
jgi:hypothetical protein